MIDTRCIYIKNTNRLKYDGYGDRNREAMRPEKEIEKEAELETSQASTAVGL